MLYLSTRNRTDSYTAHRALHEERAPDGGLYVPFQLPKFTKDEIAGLTSRSFSENVAHILNLFFSAKLSSWDVEFCCGRYPMKEITLPHRLSIAEIWHNTASDYAYVEQALYSKLSGTKAQIPHAGWARIAIRIAILFAVYGATSAAAEGVVLDVAVETDAFVSPVANWYARQMGLPIGTIICGTHNHGEVWDLLHLGEMNPSSQIGEIAGMERLIFFTLGQAEAQRYASCCEAQRSYHLEEDQLVLLNDGMFAAVVSNSRLPAVISSFYRSNGYVLDFVSAISFGALQDYRARTGESKHTLIMSETSPVKNPSAMIGLLGITAAELENAVNKQRG